MNQLRRFINLGFLFGVTAGFITPLQTISAASKKHNVLVAYFSATGTTREIAQKIAAEIDADILEIIPKIPYSSSDLNWNDPSSRCSREHTNASIRPEIAGTKPDLRRYQNIVLGYPIWWGQAPLIIRTFLEQNDFSGKTIIPFATSASSPLGTSADNLRSFAPGANWKRGARFGYRSGLKSIQSFIEENF